MLVARKLAVASPQGRFAAGAASLDGRACRAVEAYGKHLLYDFEGERTLHVHLGLFGSFRSAAQPAPAPDLDDLGWNEHPSLSAADRNPSLVGR